jgi:hypothetical protein
MNDRHPGCSSEWGLCTWFREPDAHLVHPEDLERLGALDPYGKVFYRTGIEGEYVVLQYGEHLFRVLPDRYVPIEVLPLRIGTRVRLKNQPERIGVVSDIYWHTKQGKPFYHVRFGEKKSSKRYWEEDFLCE